MPQEHRRRLHRQREPPQQPHDLLRRPALGRVAVLPAGLVALDQRQRVGLRQLIHRQEGAVCLPAEQFVLAQPCGGDQVQPVGLRQAGGLSRLQQLRPVHVVQDQQHATRRGGVGTPLQLAQHPLELQVQVLLLLVAELELQVARAGQRHQRHAEVVAALAPHLPAPARILVREGVGVLDRQGRLAHAAQAMNRGEHAHFAQADQFSKSAQLEGAAHEPLVMPVDVALGLDRLADAAEPVADLAVQLLHPRLDGGVLERLGAFVEPRAEVEVLAAAEFGHPLGGTPLVVLIGPAGHLHEIDRRHPLAQQCAGRLVLEELVELPGAKLGL